MTKISSTFLNMEESGLMVDHCYRGCLDFFFLLSKPINQPAFLRE
jgi:hypothetical protein